MWVIFNSSHILYFTYDPEIKLSLQKKHVSLGFKRKPLSLWHQIRMLPFYFQTIL